MRRRSKKLLITALVLLPYAVFGLAPQGLLDVPEVYPNQAKTDETLEFPGPGIVMVPVGSKWIETAIESGEFAVDLRVRPASRDIDGPARILTISQDPSTRNLTIAQNKDDLIVRLRRPGSDRNGRPDLLIHDVFSPEKWVDVALTLEDSTFSVAVDGQPAKEIAVTGGLGDWSPLHRVALGNEVTMDRPWLGSIERAGLRTGAVSLDLLDPAVQESPFWVVRDPSGAFGSTLDLAINYLGFIPLGLLAALWFPSLRWPMAVAIVGGIALVSLGIETAQLRLPSRSPSLLDLEMNVAGGATGVILALVLARWRRVTRHTFQPGGD